VRSMVRSANAKLDRVAAIAAAGRMCHYRYGAITAHAAGEATATEATAARAHVSACVPCGRVYRKLRREMRGREFQRAAAAAFLPLPPEANASEQAVRADPPRPKRWRRARFPTHSLGCRKQRSRASGRVPSARCSRSTRERRSGRLAGCSPSCTFACVLPEPELLR
jgi:anti-sigma factor RsiW